MNLPFSDETLIFLAVAAIVQFVVLYLVINIATKTDRRAQYEWAQLQFLAKIAKAQGVPDEDIKATFDAIK